VAGPVGYIKNAKDHGKAGNALSANGPATRFPQVPKTGPPPVSGNVDGPLGTGWKTAVKHSGYSYVGRSYSGANNPGAGTATGHLFNAGFARHIGKLALDARLVGAHGTRPTTSWGKQAVAFGSERKQEKNLANEACESRGHRCCRGNSRAGAAV